MFRFLILFFILYSLDVLSQDKSTDLKSKTNSAIIAGPGIITAYGVFAWDWSRTTNFQFRNEGWFQKNTYAGGADKFAHAYSHFVVTRAYDSYFQYIGHSPKEANYYAMFSGALVGLFIEIGDGMSHYGFAFNDLIADFVGVGFAGLLNSNKSLDELLGFQIIYGQDKGTKEHPGRKLRDPIDDYNRQTYVLNLRLSGIPHINENKFFRYLNLDFGFYSRGYNDSQTNPNNLNDQYVRNLFFGLSINFYKLFEDYDPNGNWNIVASKTSKYYQPPFTGIQLKKHSIHGEYELH